MSNATRIVERAGMDKGQNRRLWRHHAIVQQRQWEVRQMRALAARAADEAKRRA